MTFNTKSRRAVTRPRAHTHNKATFILICVSLLPLLCVLVTILYFSSYSVVCVCPPVQDRLTINWCNDLEIDITSNLMRTHFRFGNWLSKLNVVWPSLHVKDGHRLIVFFFIYVDWTIFNWTIWKGCFPSNFQRPLKLHPIVLLAVMFSCLLNVGCFLTSALVSFYRLNHV